MPIKLESEKTFGEYIEMLRREQGRSIRETAFAVGVSPQFYSEIEKGRRSVLIAERLDKLKTFLNLSEDKAIAMYNKAAEARKYKDVAVPQDFSDYIVERDYTMAALRVAKELNADEEDWRKFVEDLRRRKGAAK